MNKDSKDHNVLEFTGERFTPECRREIWYEHMHRYALAARLCSGRKVLDAACGEGYGSFMLSRAAESVIGLDLSTEAIDHARVRYAGQGNLEFQYGDCTRLPFHDDQFDCVVSFETLEHLEDQQGMLREFSRVLNPGGFLLLSSPDKAIYADQADNQNEFHVRELYRDELEALLAEHFPAWRLLGQKLMFHSAIWSLGDSGGVALQQLDEASVHESAAPRHAPMYFLALCAHVADALPVIDANLWLFDDADESVYQHYLGEIRRNMAAGGAIAEREQEIATLKQRLEEESRSHRSWISRLLGRG